MLLNNFKALLCTTIPVIHQYDILISQFAIIITQLWKAPIQTFIIMVTIFENIKSPVSMTTLASRFVPLNVKHRNIIMVTIFENIKSPVSMTTFASRFVPLNVEHRNMAVWSQSYGISDLATWFLYHSNIVSGTWQQHFWIITTLLHAILITQCWNINT